MVVRYQASEVNLRDLYRIFLRHQRRMLLFFLAAMGASAGIIVFAPRSYRSEGRLFVRLGRENVAIDPTATLGQPAAVAIPINRESELNSVVALLKSRMLAEKVVDELGPQTILHPKLSGLFASSSGVSQKELPAAKAGLALWGDLRLLDSLPDREKAVLALLKSLRIETIKKSDVVQISCESPTPELSQQVVETLIERYLDEHIEANRTPGSRQFFAQQTERLRNELSAKEAELLALKNETGLAAPEEQRKLMVVQIARLEDELLTAEAAAEAARAEVRSVTDKLTAFPETKVTAHTTGYANMASDTMRAKLYELEMKEQELQAKYTDAHPELRRLREQLSQSRAILQREDRSRTQVTTGPSRTNEQAQLALLEREPAMAALAAKAETLRRQLAEARERMAVLNGNDLRVARLSREVALEEANYRKYSETLEQAKIDEALQLERISNIRVVQPASYEMKPVRPRRLLTLALGGVIGLCGAVGLALMAESQRQGRFSG
ncbi:MAG TPA: GumC family protein [Pirellulales bacterium]|nr:GumC family protein [Pirellulales bacterium]